MRTIYNPHEREPAKEGDIRVINKFMWRKKSLHPSNCKTTFVEIWLESEDIKQELVKIKLPNVYGINRLESDDWGLIWKDVCWDKTLVELGMPDLIIYN